MESMLGTSIGVYVGVTGLVMGFCAWMTGQAIGNTWRPFWQALAYSALLAVAARFLIYALFHGTLLTLSGYLCDAVLLMCIASLSFRLSRTRKMVTQYPWLYTTAGPFFYRERGAGEP
ncbi:MAG: hypothetical protein KDK91_24155 [Gammaproteobacteria bacterium]|nr:hypothetical protein [Gammaproteobacteria bacterium]